MKEGAKLLLGTQNFSTFRAASCGAKSPIRTMEKILIKKNKDKITLQFTSRSFLQQQVRSMVGCIKYLGEGKWDLDKFKAVFKSKNRSIFTRCFLLKILRGNRHFLLKHLNRIHPQE